MSNSCPPPEALRSYLTGKTADAETEIVENHLANCQRCQVYLEILSEESDSLLRLVSDAAAVPQVAGGVGVDSPSLRTGFVSRGKLDSSATARSGEGDSTYMIRDYRILECIGQGGMGSVYRALHVRLNQQRAVKILKSDRMGSPDAISRFAREMKLLAQLEHRHIVRAFDAGEQDGIPYFVMEFISGINLNQLVRRLGPLPVPEACSIVRLAASALQYAHEQKVIHRDIKPSNLMITADGEVKLLDLGLAQILEMEGDDAVSRADQILGTLAYMSPEQLSGRRQVTPQSDIFSLGVTLHELLTGQRPFERPGMPPLVSDIRSVRPDVDENLSALVGDMIALTPSERPLTMTEVESRLNAISTAENLRALVAEYYRWDNRSLPRSKSEFSKADTETVVARHTNSQPVSTPLGITSPTMDPQFSGLWKSHGVAKWVSGLVLASALVAIGWLAAMEKIILWPKPKVMTVVDKIRGKILVEANEKVGNIGRQLLAEGKTKAIGDTGDRHDVVEGLSELPVGKYQIVYDGPDEFEQEGDAFEVYATGTTRLSLSPILSKQFQYPDIPEQAGANATYHGSLWRSGWKENAQSLKFNIYLEVTAIVTKPNFPATKWLKIEVKSKGEEDYCETAFLNVDAKKWETARELDIREGWIVANSLAIEKHMNKLNSNRGKVAEFIVRFDSKHDFIGEMTSIPLPKQRLSVQDVLALFFGQEMSSAGGEINSVRASLPNLGNRKASLEFVSDARGPVPCYVVSNRDQWSDTSKPGFMMARRKSGKFNPFGFLKVEVNSPSMVVAECVIKNCSEAVPDVDALYRRLEELRQNEFDPNQKRGKRPSVSTVPRASWLSDMAYSTGYSIGSFEVPTINLPIPKPVPIPTTTRFDIALVPNDPSSQTFIGEIKLNKDHSENITATVRMLGEEQIDERSYRWIDIDVTSRMNESDHWEAVRVLIDAKAYNDSGDFLIKQGWIAYGNKETVFEIPSNGNLDPLVDFRLQLQRKPEWKRIGVIDVLSMMFNADLKPSTSISSLRAKIAGNWPGMSRVAKSETLRHKSGQILACERWEPPIFIPQMNYSFLRSSQVPFGFVSVTLNRDELSIGLEMDKHRRLLPYDVATSAFGTKDQLNALLQSNGIRLKPVANSNWRVWTWHHAGKTYKAWAEFGGEIDPVNGGDVLLRDEAELEIRVPKNSLSDSDVAFIDAGRIWPSIDTRRRVLVEDNISTNAFVFRIPGNAQKEDRYRDFALKPIDIAWLNKLRAAKKLKPDRQNVIQDWQSFAGYIK